MVQISLKISNLSKSKALIDEENDASKFQLVFCDRILSLENKITAYVII